ncbi:MAG TPA: polysaccharide deacetylase family protein [Solirubrobacteraceae bacterium]|nr:polysaccharide deacetylase family protein [Solirubrobacteraceae bacterium]
MDRRAGPGRAFATAVYTLLFATVGCAGSTGAPAAQQHAPRPAVPILMYHVIAPIPADARLPALFVSPPRFAAHVRALRRAGYTAVTMQQVWDAWHRGGRLPRRPVVISFDDGTEGHVRHALPTLRRVRWPGVLNLAWSFLPDIGGTAAVRRLARASWEIDSHSLTHPDLTRLSDAELRRELTSSRTRIRRAFGPRAANFFAYPSGRHDARVRRAVRAAGYLAATTVKRGLARPTADPYALSRIQVSGGTSATALLRRLRDLRP